MVRVIIVAGLSFLLFSCGKKDKLPDENPARIVKVPMFQGDSAYGFVNAQVKFGPRIPNSSAHRQAGDYLISRLKSYGAEITVQEFEANSFDGQKLFLRNIVGSLYPEKQKRILLAAHWDTRPFADKDPDQPTAKFDGANDGASGVAVLLEIARTMSKNSPPNVGIDIIFFDGEDWGEKENMSGQANPPEGYSSWWCLGSQYWTKKKHKVNYSAYYGILLDMVGAKNSHFFQEGNSVEYAPKIVEKVWSTASRLGYSSIFVNQKEGGIMDDHLFINEESKIPMIDIVHFDPAIGFFGDYHHTRKDNMSIISHETLQAVGSVLLNVIYYEE